MTEGGEGYLPQARWDDEKSLSCPTLFIGHPSWEGYSINPKSQLDAPEISLFIVRAMVCRTQTLASNRLANAGVYCHFWPAKNFSITEQTSGM